jgi:AcrR family transcriptional regulator
MSPRVGLEFQSILNTAIEIIDIEGMEALTITTLASKLNIKPPSLYNHINGLQDLRNKLALYGMKQLYTELQRGLETTNPKGPVKSIALSYISFARKHPGLYEATIKVPDNSDQSLQEAANKIVSVALTSIAPYNFNDNEAIHVVRGLRSVLHGFASLEQHGGFGLSLNPNESLNLLIDTYLSGLQSLANKGT